MPKPKSFLRVFTEAGPLVTLLVAVALLLGVAAPASAQFFNFPSFGGPPQRPAPQRGGGGGWFGSDFFSPFQQPQQQQQAPRQDFSRAPPPAKRETVPERNVLVLGDAMADWLAYGLEDAYSEQPDMGVIRKHKTVSGLIKYQPKGEPADWAAAARGILATEKADAIVVMLGLNDRTAIREPVVDKSNDKKGDKDKKDARAKPDAKPGEAKPDAAAKADDKPVDTELSPDDAENDTAQHTAPEKTARTPNGLYEFRDDRWVELYSKKIEEMINVLKSKGVPVLWVGLPAIRGQKGTADMLFLDALYRDAAGKAGITYVDVWDGFVDEAGRFMQKGPDFEGQIRQLRSYDGVFFTKPGARKLAHYVEREVTRLLAARSGPIALPSEPATPEVSAEPGKPAPRPLAGPILPLVASSVGTDQLLGGPGSRPAAVDALAARTLVKGEALAAPAGRADDFAWPRREIGREQARGDTPVAATTPTTPASPGSANPPPTTTAIAPDGSIITTPQKPAQKKLFRPAQTQPATPSLRDFFGFGSPPQRPLVTPPPRAPGGPPRPPANVGRSAAVQ
ncbi:SGNH family hydrolase [Bradyrhizobium erythrophlei]|uniref:SGNH/GDSL hydrolase family protein n=1 Tax=Bradyrhizobium erythrophlei TaxID=1437360 RepID=UPI0035ECE9D8